MAFVAVVGGVGVGVLYRVGHLPQVGETVLAEHFWLDPGGKAGNQAMGIRWLGGNGFGHIRGRR